jgi:hypothetical protein
MMSQKWLWSVCCAVTVAFEGAHATPTTHIWSPSTDVQPFKLWHLTSDFYVPTETVDGVRPATITNFGLTVGVLPFKNINAEVGVDHKSGTGVDAYPIYFNTKVGIPEDAFGRTLPAFAVGIYDVGTQEDKTSFNVVYAKAAKTLKLDELSLGRFSAGYFAGNPDLLRDGEEKDNHGSGCAWTIRERRASMARSTSGSPTNSAIMYPRYSDTICSITGILRIRSRFRWTSISEASCGMPVWRAKATAGITTKMCTLPAWLTQP